MLIVSSTVGSPTSTGWKRRSSAASFSMCLRYSSSVVAPIVCSSPRASIGLSMLEASSEPSDAPAPTTVCSSSMNRTISPCALTISCSTAFRRSSNSPRYFAPATSDPMSSATMRLFLRPSGTSPRMIRWARPSTMAVLPTPGSPISTGLFLVRRDSTWITRRISSSRPMTGSSLPSRAAAVRSRPYFSSASYLPSGLWSVTRCVPRTATSVSRTLSRVAPTPCRAVTAGVRPPSPAMASRKCSVLRYSSLSWAASFSAASNSARRRGPMPASLPPWTFGRLARSASRVAAECGRVDLHLAQHGRHDAALLAHERGQQVFRVDLRVTAVASPVAARRRRPPGPFR